MYRDAAARASSVFVASAVVAVSAGFAGCASNNVTTTSDAVADGSVEITVRSLDGSTLQSELAPDARVLRSDGSAGEIALPELDASAEQADAGATGLPVQDGLDAQVPPAPVQDAQVQDAQAPSAQTPDAAPASCDLQGKWALKLKGAVTSSQTPFTSSNGDATAWLLFDATGSGGSYTATTRVCGVQFPSIDLRPEFGSESYAMQFPRNSPDGLQGGSVTLHAKDDSVSVDAFAVLLGAKTDGKASDAWPSDGSSVAFDADSDNKPGLTVTWSTSNGKVLPPLDVSKSSRARDSQLTARLVVGAASFSGCDTWNGTTGSARIDSHVLGCTRSDGSACTPDQLTLQELIRPQYDAQQATLQAARLSGDARCSDALTKLP